MRKALAGAAFAVVTVASFATTYALLPDATEGRTNTVRLSFAITAMRQAARLGLLRAGPNQKLSAFGPTAIRQISICR